MNEVNDDLQYSQLIAINLMARILIGSLSSRTFSRYTYKHFRFLYHQIQATTKEDHTKISILL